MELQIKDMFVEQSHVKVNCSTIDKDVAIGDVFKTKNGKLFFKVISFETDGFIYDSIRFNVTLHQHGYRRDFIKDINNALDCIGQTLIKVIDKEELKRINHESSYL